VRPSFLEEESDYSFDERCPSSTSWWVARALVLGRCRQCRESCTVTWSPLAFAYRVTARITLAGASVPVRRRSMIEEQCLCVERKSPFLDS
jgi:hypothetical protein